jgi:hypothetical protein
MKNLLIGSRALAEWDNDFVLKESADWDVISEKPIEGFEWHDPSLLDNFMFERYSSGHVLTVNGVDLHVVNPIGLAIIKRSHLWRALGFRKHITHYHKHLQKFSNFFEEDDKEMLRMRIKMTMDKFPQQGPNLKQTVEDFFDDAVTKKYNHDWLHELYAFEDAPMYTKMQRDSSLAWCEKDMWDEMSHGQKVRCVAEETYVIATERFLVPTDFKTPAKLAYMKSLEKVCTTLCKGWFRDFAIDYYPEVINVFDPGKVEKVKSILKC